MELAGSRVQGASPWKWDCEVVVHDCMVPLSRAASAGDRRVGYDLDIREVVVGRAENMRRVLAEGVPQLVRVLPGASLERFHSRAPGSFDHRIDVLAAFVGSEIRFEPRDRAGDGWQLPEETLALRTGDCEDRAILLCALAIASGVSPYNLRVAIGKVRVHSAGDATDHHHVWLKYKNERGCWTIVEPFDPVGEMNAAPDKPVLPPEDVSIAYLPRFVFNDAHVWTLRGPEERPRLSDELAERAGARMLTPAFLGAVHRDVITEALAFLRGSPEAWVIDPIGRYFKAILRGRVADWPSRIALHLSPFKQACDLDAFARVAHAFAERSAARPDARRHAELVDEIRASFQSAWTGS